jgi:hypothetical protein
MAMMSSLTRIGKLENHGFDDTGLWSSLWMGDRLINSFLQRFLVDPSTLNIVNHWRRERGEPELRLSDLAPPEHTPEST